MPIRLVSRAVLALGLALFVLPVAAQGDRRFEVVDAELVAQPHEPAMASRRSGDAIVSVIVGLEGAPAWREYVAAGGRRGGDAALRQVQAGRVATLRAEQAAVATALRPLGARVTRQFQFLHNALVVTLPLSALPRLARVPGVVSIAPNRIYERAHTTSMPLARVTDVWRGAAPDALNLGLGTTVAVIDEGIDYTHRHFGGAGNYAANDSTALGDVAWPPALPPSAAGDQLVIGGTDFVGDDYNASTGAPAMPDPDPVGCPYSHGTHVAGTIAGHGVTAAGETFTGDVSDIGAFPSLASLFPAFPSPSTAEFRIGPGVAPRASLVSLRVFGCGGSTGTDVLLQAFEAVATGSWLGQSADVVNLSLGSAYGGTGPDDFLLAAIDALSEMGIVVVASAGNSGDVHLVTGAPGTARTAISVANVTDTGVGIDGVLDYVHPVTADPVRIAAPRAAMYVPPLSPQLTAPMIDARAVAPADEFACTALTGSGYAGKWVLVQRGGPCGTFSLKASVVKAAGAAGMIVVNNVAGTPISMGRTAGYDDVLPAVMVSNVDGDAIRTLLASNPIDGSVDTAQAAVAPNTVASVPEASTSRGGVLRGNEDRILKPNLSAPGSTITSAGAGTNNGGYTISGTSMAAPHIAGAAALMIARLGKPVDGAGVARIKQRLMNTATRDLRASVVSETPNASPQRVGAGLVDPRRAIDTPIVAFASDAPENVSLSFGYPRQLTGEPVSIDKTLTIRNLGNTAVQLDASYLARSAWPGASVTLGASSVLVPAFGDTTLTVTLEVSADAPDLNVGGDPLFLTTNRTVLYEVSGLVQLSDAGDPQNVIRVPVYAAPHLASDLTSPASLPISGGSGSAAITLGGAGFDLGIGSNDHASATTAFELLATSGVEDGVFWDVDGSGTNEPGEALVDYAYADIAQVGATLVEASPDVAHLVVGLKMHDEWTTPRDLFVEAYLDVDDDGLDDQVLYYSSAPSDTFSLSFANSINEAFSFGDLVNHFHGVSFDTKLLRNDVMAMPLRIRDPNLPSVGVTSYADGPIRLTLRTYQRDSDFSFPIDEVQVRFTPRLAFAQTVYRNLYVGTDGAQIGFDYDFATGEPLRTAPSILTLHHHNLDAATRAQVTTLTLPPFDLASPPDGTTALSGSVPFGLRWIALEGATEYTVNLMRLLEPDPETVASITGTAAADDDAITCAGSVCVLSSTALPALVAGSYEWDVATPLDGGVTRVAQNGPWDFTLVEDPDIFDDGFED
jgi:subtilisin family serine protease